MTSTTYRTELILYHKLILTNNRTNPDNQDNLDNNKIRSKAMLLLICSRVDRNKPAKTYSSEKSGQELMLTSELL